MRAWSLSEEKRTCKLDSGTPCHVWWFFRGQFVHHILLANAVYNLTSVFYILFLLTNHSLSIMLCLFFLIIIIINVSILSYYIVAYLSYWCKVWNVWFRRDIFYWLLARLKCASEMKLILATSTNRYTVAIWNICAYLPPYNTLPPNFTKYTHKIFMLSILWIHNIRSYCCSNKKVFK